MLDNQEKRILLNKILQSEEFINSQLYQSLLSYLVEAHIRQFTPKEYQLATEVFHKSSDFDPNQDTIVRVHIYNLRKKLAQYYSDEGKNERIRIEIPKGHYEIIFSSYKKVKNTMDWGQIIGLFIIMFLLISNVFFIHHYFRQKPLSQSTYDFSSDKVWGGFLSSTMPKEIVLGDHFFFIKDSRIPEKRTLMRRDDINNQDDLEKYKALDKERQTYKPLNYPVFPKNSVWPFSDMVKSLGMHLNYELNFSTNVTGEDIKNNNLIFIGSFHTLAAFNQAFSKSVFNYHVYPNVLTYLDQSRDTVITLPEVGDPVFYHIDYGVVKKVPGPNHNIIFIFSSFHETGTIGIIRFFLDPKSLQDLENLFVQKFGHVPEYFEILFKSSGYNRTVYKTEIQYLCEINPDMTFW